jgi:hypothetical protein
VPLLQEVATNPLGGVMIGGMPILLQPTNPIVAEILCKTKMIG